MTFNWLYSKASKMKCQQRVWILQNRCWVFISFWGFFCHKCHCNKWLWSCLYLHRCKWQSLTTYVLINGQMLVKRGNNQSTNQLTFVSVFLLYNGQVKFEVILLTELMSKPSFVLLTLWKDEQFLQTRRQFYQPIGAKVHTNICARILLHVCFRLQLL